MNGKARCGVTNYLGCSAGLLKDLARAGPARTAGRAYLQSALQGLEARATRMGLALDRVVGDSVADADDHFAGLPLGAERAGVAGARFTNRNANRSHLQ